MIEDPQKGRVIASSILIFSDQKKPRVSYLIQWLPDGHDSQVIPEENTGTFWLDIGLSFSLSLNSIY